MVIPCHPDYFTTNLGEALLAIHDIPLKVRGTLSVALRLR